MRGVRINLTGKTFGKWKVLGEHTVRQKGNVVWRVQCECSSAIRLVRTVALLRKTKPSRSCGCVSKKQPGEAAQNVMIKQYKRGAKNRGLSWELTRYKVLEVTGSPCFYCGAPYSSVSYPSESSNGTYLHNGIDRIDNLIGYVSSNVVPCCRICNWAKGTKSSTEFNEYMFRLIAHSSTSEHRLTHEDWLKTVNPVKVNGALSIYKNNARRAGRTWDISDDLFNRITRTLCHYCGLPPSNVIRFKTPYEGAYYYGGIDRVNNDLGYSEKNILPCCSDCNRAKSNRSYSEFKNWVETIVCYQTKIQTINIYK